MRQSFSSTEFRGNGEEFTRHSWAAARQRLAQVNARQACYDCIVFVFVQKLSLVILPVELPSNTVTVASNLTPIHNILKHLKSELSLKFEMKKKNLSSS